MRVLIAAAAVVLTACTSTGGGAPEPPPPATLTYRPDTAHYLLAGWRRVEQEFQGQVTEQASRLQAWISTALGAGSGDSLAARLVLDSVVTTGNVFAAADLQSMRGATWTGHLLPTGQLVDVAGPAEPGIASQMHATLTAFYPRLPAAGVTPGDAWVDTITSDVDVGGVVLTIVTVNHSEAVGPAPWEGTAAFLIRVTSSYTLTGQGSQNGQPLTLDGRGRRQVEEYLTPQGRYLGNVLADTSSYDVVLTALGMAIPGRQWRHDTLRVLR